MRLFFRFGFLSLLFVLSSCVPSPVLPTLVGPTVTYNPFATLSPTPFGPAANTPTYTPTHLDTPIIPTPTTAPAAQESLRTQYFLDAMLDYLGHSLRVREKILFQNNTGKNLDQLVLAVEPNHWTDCFFLDAIQLNTGTPFYTLEGHSLEIPLSPPLVAGGEVVLSLDYHLNLPASDEHHLFGYKTNQVNLVDWYPFIVPYRDDWLLHAPSEVGEHLVYDSVDFDVTMQVVPSMTIAASAPLVDGRYRLEKARTIVFSASPDFETTAETIAGVNVNSYYFESEKASGETLLHETGAALTTFNDLFLEYPYPSLSIVESGFFDGMEYDGLFFIGRDYYISNDGTKLNYLIDLAVHETAHQWWFGMVGNDQALEPWLDESLSTYSELLFYEKNYPGISESWWQFRVDRYSPSGKVDSTIYTLNELQAYTNSVYFQGARFLRDLRAAVGDEPFYSFMESYVSQMAGRISTAEDFFRILRQYTNVDLSGIQDTYFEFQH